VQRLPGVAISVVDDRTGTEDLPDAGGILSNDGHDQVGEFVELEGLFHDRAHAEVAGVFVGVADGDLLRKGHGR